MISDKKYVNILSSQAEKVKTEINVNNQDITITQNGNYQAEPPYTGFGLVRVAVPTSSGVINPLSVSPSTEAQVINAPNGVDGFNPVSVNAVTAVIDSNIQANNIKAGVSILGVTGNVVELNGEERTVSLTSSSGNTFTPSIGKNGITSITVKPNNYSEGIGEYGPVYEIVASTEGQSIKIPEGYSGFANLFCDGVDASIDPNIVAGNIKKNVTILGVTGTLESGSAPAHYIEKTAVDGQLRNSTNIIDLTGITDIGDYALSGQYFKASFPINTSVNLSSLTTISGSYACYNMFNSCSGIMSIDLSSLTTISGGYACQNMFGYCDSITSVDLSSLTTISGSNACYAMFISCDEITSVDLSGLTTISGSNACQNMFQSCSMLTSADLSGLTTISGSNACSGMFVGCSNITSVDLSSLTVISGLLSASYSAVFAGCTHLESVKFGGLKSTTFASAVNQLQYLFGNTTGSQAPNGCTVHFPSNFDPSDPSHTFDASTLAGYPTFGGNASYIKIAFDLTSTE